MDSIWVRTAEDPRFWGLSGDTKTDVLIIGGGIAGILCAHRLVQAGVDCLLVEAGRICHGITKNTTAKITVQHGLIYDRLLRRFGKETARGYFAANQAALKEYRRLCREIDCDYHECDALVYSKHDRQALAREYAALRALDIPATQTNVLPLPFPTVGGIRMEGQATFHPLKFLYTIARGLPIAEGTKVLSLRPDGARTSRGNIAANRIIVTTHFPILNKHGAFFLKMYQQRSYVLALENAPLTDEMYVDASGNGLSFRRAGELLLLGGGGHRTGKSGGNWQVLADFARRYFPQAREVCRFATQDCMTLDGMPYIGQYSKRTPNLYVATGFNKWGMTSAMASADILTDLILGKDNLYAKIFTPSRSILHPQLACNVGETLVNMLRPGAPRCPHLGCALRYNHAEHSWDCPCHGSRFDEDGSLIDNPATDDKRL